MKKGMQLFVLVVLTLFFVRCTSSDDQVDEKQYGQLGTHTTTTYTAGNYAYTTIYYPTDLSSLETKTPLLFFASGWFGNPESSAKYETLLKFIASHGYSIIYTDEGSTTSAQHSIDAYNRILNTDFVQNNILPYVDTTQTGVVGHSAGGGITFTILDYYTREKGYGENGRFIMALDPWYAFGMTADMMKNLPSNTNVSIIKFGEGGNNAADGTDARIPLTEYYLLESIANTKKDYQVYDDENADHGYPTGNRSFREMQGILKPLDALLEYTFVKQSEEARIAALENGTDDPYANGNGIQVVLDTYQYPCDGANTLIDYCAIVQ